MFSRLPFRLLRLTVLFGLVVGLLVVFIQQSQGNYPLILKQLVRQLNLHLPRERTAQPFQLSKPALVLQLNELRQKSKLKPLTENPKLSQAAELVLEELQDQPEAKITNELLEKVFRRVGFVNYVQTTSNLVVGPEFIYATSSGWLTERVMSQDLKNPQFTQFGLALKALSKPAGLKEWQTVLILAQPKKPTPTLTKKKPQTTRLPSNKQPTVKPKSSSIKFPEISDQEVVEALNRYRADHKVHPLIIDQNLCEYAEKRVKDLLKYGGLDNHEGFKKDFAVDSPDDLPEPIKRYPGGAIGENLAYQYCKNMKTGESFIAQTGTALIEWCFDSSTAGHREAQLNPRYNAVCVRHAKGYYVVIFGE